MIPRIQFPSLQWWKTVRSLRFIASCNKPSRRKVPVLPVRIHPLPNKSTQKSQETGLLQTPQVRLKGKLGKYKVLEIYDSNVAIIYHELEHPWETGRVFGDIIYIYIFILHIHINIETSIIHHIVYDYISINRLYIYIYISYIYIIIYIIYHTYIQNSPETGTSFRSQRLAPKPPWRHRGTRPAAAAARLSPGGGPRGSLEAQLPRCPGSDFFVFLLGEMW